MGKAQAFPQEKIGTASLVKGGGVKCRWDLATTSIPPSSPLCKGGKKAVFTLAEGVSHGVVSDSNRKIAFTLAEVLITLGIIGVVAAMTLPTVVNNYQKKTLQTQFLKTLSDLNNASKLFEVHEGQSVQEFSKNIYSGYISTHILKQFLKYFKYNTQISQHTVAFKNLGYSPKTLGGQEPGVMPCDESSVLQEVGSRIFIMDNALVSGSSDYSNIKVGPKICVDTNGKKGPNKYGYDWFVFAFTDKGIVIPYIGNSLSGYGPDLADPSIYCNYTQTAATYTCAYYALNDTSPLDSGKSYWKDFLK